MIRGPRSRMPSDNIEALGMTTMIPQPQYLQTRAAAADAKVRAEYFRGHNLGSRYEPEISGSGLGGSPSGFSFGTPATTDERQSRYGGPRHGGVVMKGGRLPGPRSRAIAGQGYCGGPSC